MKTTGALEIEAAEVPFDDDDGSRRFAYKESPPLEGVGAEGCDITNIWKELEELKA